MHKKKSLRILVRVCTRGDLNSRKKLQTDLNARLEDSPVRHRGDRLTVSITSVDPFHEEALWFTMVLSSCLRTRLHSYLPYLVHKGLSASGSFSLLFGHVCLYSEFLPTICFQQQTLRAISAVPPPPPPLPPPPPPPPPPPEGHCVALAV